MKKTLKIKWSRKFKGEPSTGRYFVSFLLREIIKPLKKNIGMDLGIKDFAVKNMIKNRRLSRRAIADLTSGEIVNLALKKTSGFQ
jgi:hypothetical protein